MVSMTAQEIAEVIAKHHTENENINYYGIRFDDAAMNPGDLCRASHDWDFENDCESEEYLPGTCVSGIGYLWFDGDDSDVSAIQKALDANNDYRADYQYLVAGDAMELGDDANEMVLANAVVVCKL